MDVYKDFIQRLRRKELEDVYLILAEDVIPTLKEYVLLLKNVEFEDGRYHIFYGEVKRIVASFIVFYRTIADEVIKQAETYAMKIVKDDLLFLMDRTESIQRASQDEFKNSFLPKTALEKQVYDEVEGKYNEYTKKLSNLRETLNKLDKRKQDQIDDFANKHIPLAVKKTSEMFDMVHVYIGMMLADYLGQTRISLEEILHREMNNLQTVQENNEDAINSLLHQLYDKNKEYMTVTRLEANNSTALAEANRAIENVRMKLENFQPDESMHHLEKEVTYWKKRMENFNVIAENLTKLKAEQDKVVQSEQMYNAMKCAKSGCKMDCNHKIRAKLAQKKQDFTQLIINETKALISFFAIRGNDRILYTDNIGQYYVDEFNHQVYVFDYGMGMYHVNCDGEFKNFPDNEYYFDRVGRYFKKDGEKVYQIAPCTSQYVLNICNRLTKVSKDCGHSEKVNKNCKMQISDHTKMEILPDFDPLDIKQTLDTETVKYLWDNFGGVLSEALHDVEKTRPKNPIHFLAHKLLYHKYRRTTAELRQKKIETQQYRSNIIQERKEQAIAASKQWKSKQVKRRKPEESDDVDAKIAFSVHAAEQMFIQHCNFFN